MEMSELNGLHSKIRDTSDKPDTINGNRKTKQKAKKCNENSQQN